MRGWEVETIKYDPQELTMCALCRNANDQECPDCEIIESTALRNNTVLPSTSFRFWCRNTLFTLLCARKRPECPFSLLDIQVTSKIYSFCIEEGEGEPSWCDIMRLDCGHRFHSHCAMAWFKGHYKCPLCDTFWSNSIDTMRSHGRVLKWRGRLVNCAIQNKRIKTE